MPILNVNHTALRVKNLKKALNFYHEVLGLPIVQIIGSKNEPKIVFLQGIELSGIKPS